MSLAPLRDLFFSELSDEAAAQIADFLTDLALHFESSYLSQIRRHHHALRPHPVCDPRQLDLFETRQHPF
jgi:hypothetical protein